MSEFKNSHDQNDYDDGPRSEPWLGVMASSIVPLVIAANVHGRYLAALSVAALVLFLAGLVMLRRQTVQRRRERRRTEPGARSSARASDGAPLELADS
jgi:ferric-dicitrate binding protein FerR (iron transport regulator)